jgi:hypothetical protein
MVRVRNEIHQIGIYLTENRERGGGRGVRGEGKGVEVGDDDKCETLKGWTGLKAHVCALPPTSHHQLCHHPSGSKTNQTLCSRLAHTCQTGCYDAFCRPSPLYVQPGQQSGKPFHPGERQKLILFQLRHRVSHYIDLQFTAVRRHSQQEASWTGNIITTSWGSANSISGQKVQSRYTPVGPAPGG